MSGDPQNPVGAGTLGVRPGSLGAVLEAFSNGARTTDDLRRATGLDRELVSLALDTLTSLGMVDRTSTSSGCPDGGCGGCPAPTGHGCGSPGAEARGLVTLTLTRRPNAAT
jgi:hypothetical protein